MTDQSELQAALERIDLLEQQNARLRRLLDNADAPGELRHRLRSTLSLLRSVIRGTAATRHDVADYAAHLNDRLEAILRVQAKSDAHGAVDIRSLLSDQMLSYSVQEGRRLAIDGPDLLVSPRIGQALALAFHELTVNSIEHGALGGDNGHVAVSWTMSDGMLNLLWKEDGPTISPTSEHGFGSDFITRALPHQLDARVALAIESGHVLCTMAIPLVTETGQRSNRASP